jgi:hypothetical protein
MFLSARKTVKVAISAFTDTARSHEHNEYLPVLSIGISFGAFANL